MNQKGKFSFLPLVLAILISEPSTGGLRVDFNAQNRTYDWLTDYQGGILKSRFEFKTYFSGHSNLIKGSNKRWQENAIFGFGLDRFLLTGLTGENRLSLLSAGEYAVSGLESRRVRAVGLRLGLSYKPNNIIEFRPILRADNKRRAEGSGAIIDQGVGYGIETKFNSRFYGNGAISGEFSYDKENLSNIPSDEGQGAIRAVYRFAGTDSINVKFRTAESAKKYYSGTSDFEKISKQIKQDREGNFMAAIKLPLNFRFKADGSAYLSRYLYRETDESDPLSAPKDNYHRGSGYKMGLEYRPFESLLASMAYSYGKTNQDYQNMQLDQETESGELLFGLRAALTRRDSLSADMSVGLTSYTNLNEEASGDNRDQQNLMVNARILHKFSDYFTGGINGGGSRFHQVYMFGGRSANNNRNDTYVLSPFSQWIPIDWLGINSSFEIQANYITFDFDRRRIGTKNRIFRRATGRTEFLLEISSKLSLKEGFSFRYEDYGQLIWDDGWQQAVSWDRNRYEFSHKVIYNPINRVLISPGVAWEKTRDFDHLVDPNSEFEEPIEIIRLKDQQIKWTFELEFDIRWSSQSLLSADISHRIRKFLDRPDEKSDFVSVAMEYLF